MRLLNGTDVNRQTSVLLKILSRSCHPHSQKSSGVRTASIVTLCGTARLDLRVAKISFVVMEQSEVIQMTNREALEVIERLGVDSRGYPKLKEALDMAIEALRRSEKPNRSDPISRQDAIGAIVNIPTDVYSHDRIVSVLDGAAFRQNEIIDIINALPSAQPERKNGKWIETEQDEPCFYRCSECGRLSDNDDNFCGGCGSKMN